MKNAALKKLGLAWALMLACSPALALGYRTSVGARADKIDVVVVSGTPYAMGFAQGRLMREEAVACMGRFLDGALASGEERLQIPSLDEAWATVAPFTDPRFVAELQGLADGAGVPVEMFRRAHMIPVVSDYACSGVAAWGPATKGGDLFQFRNLDFTTTVGLQDYPTIVVYLPSPGLPHVNVTFAGCIGCNTGMNAVGIVLGEKGEAPWDDFPFDLRGAHFLSMFRTILYDARTLEQAIGIMRATPRIKKYYWYLGDGKIPAAVKIKAFAPDLLIWGGGDPRDELVPNVLPHCVYQTMDNPVAFQTLADAQGQIDEQEMIALSRSVASKNGNLLNVVYNASQLQLWAAYAEKAQMASTRSYVHLKLEDYLDVAKVPEGAQVLKPEPATP